jgi:hypothetical protein
MAWRAPVYYAVDDVVSTGTLYYVEVDVASDVCLSLPVRVCVITADVPPHLGRVICIETRRFQVSHKVDAAAEDEGLADGSRL